MKKLFGATLSVAWASVFVFGCSSPPQPVPDTREADATAIREADIAWSEAQGARGLEGMMAYYTDDPIMLAPNVPMAVGKEAIRKAFAPNFDIPGFSAKWRPSKIEVARSGDIAYAIGTYEATMNDPNGNPVTDKGKYVEIWKKQADGSWKVAADMFSSDLPPPSGSRPFTPVPPSSGKK